MKRKFQKLSTGVLRELLNEYFETSHLSNDILDELSERKQRSFIIDRFINHNEFSIVELMAILEDYI